MARSTPGTRRATNSTTCTAKSGFVFVPSTIYASTDIMIITTTRIIDKRV
ncbi:predicted protein [Botrytis cinerea T4]|uniref:Uncharacterized protein n=1 Tax=Botryotinia fuckeliana (strain T4) TaxID=999810 RepID=G2XTX7_BOTF4|nr:predicted protein [Botrytis cinerea T4]